MLSKENFFIKIWKICTKSSKFSSQKKFTIKHFFIFKITFILSEENFFLKIREIYMKSNKFSSKNRIIWNANFSIIKEYLLLFRKKIFLFRFKKFTSKIINFLPKKKLNLHLKILYFKKIFLFTITEENLFIKIKIKKKYSEVVKITLETIIFNSKLTLTGA